MKIKFSGHYSDGELFIMTARNHAEFGAMAYSLIEMGAVIENVETLL